MSSEFILACLCLSASSRETAPASVRAAAPGGAEGVSDIIDERGEAAAQRLAPGHQHVVVVALRLKRLSGAQRLFQPPADPIALDRAADGFGHREANPRAGDGPSLHFLARAGLQREGLRRDTPSMRDTLKFGPSGEAADRAWRSIVAQGVKAPFHGGRRRQASGRRAGEAAAD